MNKVSTKLIVILILSALVPMTLFGIIAVWTARETSRRIVADENLQVAVRAAQQIEQYVANNVMILESLAQNLAKTDLQTWQKERIIKNYTLQFEPFRSIDLTDRQGRTVTTSRLDASAQSQSQSEAIRTALSGRIYRSEVFISKNFTPGMTVAIPLTVLGEIEGAVVGDLNLIEMWKLVDSIRIGREGYALVASKEGLLIAHGRSSAKERVFRQERMGDLPIIQSALKGEMKSLVSSGQDGLERIRVSVPIPSLGWAMVIEQPTREAYAASTRLTYQLTGLIALFLFLMILIGLTGGRRYIVAPIRELIRGIRAVGGGNLTDKVEILTRDEFRELGEAFNQMTERLSALKEDIRRNERAVFLGRIASGLVHDLRHPVKNLENSSHLVLRYFDDPKIREVFRGIVEREFPNLNRFFDDLYNLTRPTPIAPVSLNLSSLINDILEPFRIHPEDKKILISVGINPPDLKIRADRFGLERVLKNVVVNAVEAMPKGGRLLIAARTVPLKESPEPKTEIAVSDTGDGIPPDRLNTLFMDYATTKRKGLGLGLAICKKIVEEHKATIEAQSQPGHGTTIILRFPTS